MREELGKDWEKWEEKLRKEELECKEGMGWDGNRKAEMEGNGKGKMEIGREEEDCFYRKGKGVGRRMGRVRFMLVSFAVNYYERRCYKMLGT